MRQSHESIRVMIKRRTTIIIQNQVVPYFIFSVTIYRIYQQYIIPQKRTNKARSATVEYECIIIGLIQKVIFQKSFSVTTTENTTITYN